MTLCAKQAARAREVVDEFARLDDLLVGQKPPARIVERRAAQERHVGVAVVVDLFHIVQELVAGERGDALLLHLRVPVLARKIRQTQQLLVIEVVAHEMGLDVEDELAGEALRARQHQLGLAGLCRGDLENIAVDVVHGEECRRHAAARVQELPAAQAEVLAVQVSELVDPRLDLLLCSALRGREILAVGNNLSGDRRCRRCRLGTRDEALFSFTKPSAHRSPPLLMIEARADRCPHGGCVRLAASERLPGRLAAHRPASLKNCIAAAHDAANSTLKFL